MDKQHLLSVPAGMIASLTAWFALPDPHALVLSGLKIVGTLVLAAATGFLSAWGATIFKQIKNKWKS